MASIDFNSMGEEELKEHYIKFCLSDIAEEDQTPEVKAALENEFNAAGRDFVAMALTNTT